MIRIRTITIITLALLTSLAAGYIIAHSAPARPTYRVFVPDVSIAPPASPTPPGSGAQACKAGAGWPKEDVYHDAHTIHALGVCRVFDWSANVTRAREARSEGMMYYPMVWGCHVDREHVARFAMAFPGSTWLLVNEPGDPNQANCTSEEAAETLHVLRQTLLLSDAGAFRIYGFGTVYARHIGFLQGARDAYVSMYHQEIPLDGVHLHLYRPFDDRFNYQALETELSQFRVWQQGRSWLRNKPILISETGVLSASWWHGDDAQIASDFIPHFLPWLQGRKYVEGYMWFSTYYSDGLFQPSNLLDSTGSFTIVGRAYAGVTKQ